MTRFHCLKCGDLTPANDPFPWMPGGQAHAHRAGCPGGRVIPIATLCNEPTVIDESDLAPGMVATFGSLLTDYTFLVAMPLARLQEGDWLWAEGRTFPFGETFDADAVRIARRVAGPVTP